VSLFGCGSPSLLQYGSIVDVDVLLFPPPLSLSLAEGWLVSAARTAVGKPTSLQWRNLILIALFAYVMLPEFQSKLLLFRFASVLTHARSRPPAQFFSSTCVWAPNPPVEILDVFLAVLVSSNMWHNLSVSRYERTNDSPSPTRDHRAPHVARATHIAYLSLRAQTACPISGITEHM